MHDGPGTIMQGRKAAAARTGAPAPRCRQLGGDPGRVGGPGSDGHDSSPGRNVYATSTFIRTQLKPCRKACLRAGPQRLLLFALVRLALLLLVGLFAYKASGWAAAAAQGAGS